MSSEIDNRIKGTVWQSVYFEFLTNSCHFPLANVLIELIIEGGEVFESVDFYGSLMAALLQSAYLGYYAHSGKPRPFLGNLIGPLLYTIMELCITQGMFLNVPFHAAYWGFSLMIGALQHLRLRRLERLQPGLLLLENVVRSGILVVLFFFITRMQNPSASTLDRFIADKPHVFIVIAILFMGLVTGLDDIRGERFLRILQDTAQQLKQYSHWLLGRSMLSQAIADPQSLTLNRRERAVLFIDIRKFTDWSERQTPETVVSMLNCYYDAAEKCLEQMNAIQFKYTADEVMAFFLSSEEALRAALALNKVAAEVLAPYGLDAGVGVHSGPVVEGLFGSSEIKRYDIIGDTVNTAKRISSAASGGELLVSSETFRSAASLLCLLEKRQIIAKGKNRPLEVCLVCEAESPNCGEPYPPPRQ